MIFSFLIKKSRQNTKEIAIAFFFHSTGNPKGSMLDYFSYASHIRRNFPLKTDTHISDLFETLLKLSMETVQVPLIIGATFTVPWLQTCIK